MYKNSEGYADPTAGAAMSLIMKEYRLKQKKRYADKNRRKIYVASKYAGDVEANIAAAIGYCRRVIDEGHMPIASHLLYCQILNDNDPEERELGLMFGLALLNLCDEVWVFGAVSPGVAQEIEEAKRLNKRLRYFEGVGV
jgi:hypothetical protein